MFGLFSRVKVSKHAAGRKRNPDAAERKKAKRKMQEKSRRRNR